MPLWFINPSRKRKMKKNPYGKCPKCHVVLTPSGRVCAFCRGKALKKNPFTTSARKLQARRQARWLATGGKLDSLWESEKERSRKDRKKQVYKKRHNKTGKFSKNPYKKGKSMKRRRPSLKRLIARAKARLYGAARKQRIKGLRKKYRKNPWVGRGKNRRWQKRGGLDLAIRLAARAQREAVRKHGYSPSAKRAVTRFKKKAAKAYKKRLAAWRRQSKAMSPKRRPSRKSPKRKAVKRARRKAVSRVSKSRKRSLAGKKAARTRARKKAARRAAGRKAARKRKRKSGGRKMARKFRRLKHGRRTKKRHGRGVRALARSRRSIKYSRRHGSGAARRYLKRYRMRSNPIAMLKDIASNVLPLAAAFFGARFVSSKVPGLPVVGPLLGNLGSGAPVAVAGAVAIGAHFLTKKVSALAKYRSAIMSGAGLNVLFTAIDAFAPASIKGFLGMGDSGVYDEALGNYTSDVAGYE
ncbi:MAG: Sperm nuclear basic protein PL-I isoform PLIb, partial [Candidatus Jorgensenbacteria bacterium GW2011_GWC1_48_8]